MKEFTVVVSYRNVVASVKRYCAERGKPLPTITYTGTVKLHGTNAGVRVMPGYVKPQKRTGEVSIGDDNAGFAAFCYDKDDEFRFIVEGTGLAYNYGDCDITLFGEWCGGSIQNKGDLALKKLDKHFVIFSGYDAVAERYITIEQIEEWIDDNEMADLNSKGIFFVSQIPPYSITINFSRPEESLAALEAFTLSVEKQCPWGTFRGVEGIGEGIVFRPIDPELESVTNLWFKTKGTAHAGKDGKKKTNIQASPEKLESIRAVVEEVLPEWRLEQGLAEIRAAIPSTRKDLDIKYTGEFLKWVARDILKEDADIIAENGFEWKEIVRYITADARQWYIQKVDEEAFARGPDVPGLTCVAEAVKG